MKKILLLLVLCIPFIASAQIATEALIPFTQNTDGDSEVNVIDTDDDNDNVLDNQDAFPLDMTKSAASLSTIVATANADASCRGNNSGNANKNYGAETTTQLKNDLRYQLVRFTMPTVQNIVSATLTIHTNTEDDPLEVYLQSNNSWVEGTFSGSPSNGTTQGVTYSSNNGNFTNKIALGITSVPAGGIYTFDLPLNQLPTSGDFSLIVFDPGDGSDETIYTRETAGKAATVSFEYITPVTPRLIVNSTSSDTTYLTGSPFLIDFSLAQAPTSTVYVPLDIENSSLASIVGDKVLEFTPTNWNTPQSKTVTPLKPGTIPIAIRPMHSLDTFYNGFNALDLQNYYAQATDITNLGPWTIATGSTLTDTLNALSAVGSSSNKFKVLTAPTGFGVVENSGQINFSPLTYQVGTWPLRFEVTDEFGNKSYFNTSVVVTNGNVPDPVGIYVVPGGPGGGNGTAALPYNDMEIAVAAAGGGGNVYIRGGEYQINTRIEIDTFGTATTPIVIQPAPGENVKINSSSIALFDFDTSSAHIELRDIEIDGGTDEIDFWCIVSNSFWGDLDIPRGCGIAVSVDGEYITVQNCYIHDCYQKAIEIRRARYLKAYNNIIHGIATTSISGGHGIMRQQQGGEIFTNDLPIPRWDIKGNLIFNVEQRIYSWVPLKGYIEMVIDEGKPILIDDPKDTDNVQEFMMANIENNVVAFGTIDHIRLKSTPNLTVKNNTVYSASPMADGITDKVGDTQTPQFTGTKIQNNAVQTMPGTQSFEMGDILGQGNATGNVAPVINGNYASGGLVLPNSVTGITATTNDLFIDPNNGNFRIKPSLNLPSTLGVPNNVLDSMDALVAKYAVDVKWDRWENDHLKLTQTILDNIPGVNDGIPNNETVFPDVGVMDTASTQIIFNVIPGTAWKTRYNAPNHEDFELNEVYTEWYEARKDSTKNSLGNDYTRIRWGNSFTKQDQVFQGDWLTNSQITAPDSNTVIYSEANHFTLDGDLLIDFEGYTPMPGDKWNLMEAGSISTANTGGNLFDSVKFEGANLLPSQFALSVINIEGGRQALELQILSAPLSLELLSFQVNKQKGHNLITWVTENETDLDRFELMRGQEVDKLEKIYTVLPANRKGDAYRYTDNDIKNGFTYYQLNTYDVDQTLNKSQVVSVYRNNTSSLIVYPNPAKETLNISFDNNTTASKSLKVIDATGKVVMQRTIAKGTLSYSMSVKELVNGLYILEIAGKNQSPVSLQFIKTN